MRVLWLFVPDEALVLLFMLAGFALMFGFRQVAAGLFVTALLCIILPPFIEELMAQAPAWLSLLILVVVGIALVRGVMESLIGKRATGNVIAELILSVLRSFFWVLSLPFRLIIWAFTGARRRGFERD